MPIKIPENLPARKVLEREGVMVIGEKSAIRQDIRPLRIALLNLMPLKIGTETQIARVLGNTPLQVELSLLAPTGYEPRNTSRAHMLDFYHPFATIRDHKFDGLIVTGAPIERLPFEGVDYWDELRRIFDWSTTHVHGLYTLCWGAQAALYHFHAIPKHPLAKKHFGVFPHRITTTVADDGHVRGAGHSLLCGLDDFIPVPVSRYTENHAADFAGHANLEILLTSDVTGPCLVYDHDRRHVHMFNHLEYDKTTLDDEYRRDLEKGRATDMPVNYYPGDDPALPPTNTWRANAHLIFGNWINMLYQTTPFDIETIGRP